VEKITLALEAMATRFELVLVGEDPVQLRAAGEEALAEIERIESQLSLYRPASEIARANARAAAEPVRVTPMTFALLEKARSFWELTGGSFDITIGPLVRCWGFMKGSGAWPSDEQIEAARTFVGMDRMTLDKASCSVRFERSGMMIDLGSIGKGHALDVAIDVLRDAGIQNALLHGGTSTIYGLGHDLSGPWRIALDKPQTPSIESSSPTSTEPIAVIELVNEAMSMSAVWGKFFTFEGKTYGHLIDPRTGWPVERALLGCAIMDAAADSDALSTGILLGNRSDLDRIGAAIPQLRYLQARFDETGIEYLSRGINLIKQPGRRPERDII
jgi:FAD:protein FMN transferase